jgi:hypothetical protein
MPIPKYNLGKSYDSIVASDMSKANVVGDRLARNLELSARKVIESKGVTITSIEAKAAMKNLLDGNLTLNAKFVSGNFSASMSLSLPVENEKFSFSEASVLSALESGIKASKEKKLEISAMPEVPEMFIDLSEIQAKKNGSLVVFQAESLPSWNIMASIEDLKDEGNRKLISGRVLASLRGHCLTAYNRVAAFSKPEFSIPMIQESVVQAKATPLSLEKMQELKAKAAEHDGSHGVNILASLKRSAAEVVVTDPNSNTQQFVARKEFESSIRETVSKVASGFIKAALGISKIDITGVDFSACKKDLNGANGDVLVGIKYCGNLMTESMTLVIPFKEGSVVASGVCRSEADIKASELKAKQLEILSSEEADKQFKAYIANIKSEGDLKAKLGIKSDIQASAGMGYNLNLQRQGPGDRIPIRKTMLPSEYSIAGKKILVDGYVYELKPTDYNSLSIESSAFWELNLTDLPQEKADFRLRYS